MAKKSQIEKFREAAREAEADESEERFNERLKEIAQQKPNPPKPKVEGNKAPPPSGIATILRPAHVAVSAECGLDIGRQ